MTNQLVFPRGFLWGTASSAHQVEGNNFYNQWWRFEQRPGAIWRGDRSGLACDWWRNAEQDFDRMIALYRAAAGRVPERPEIAVLPNLMLAQKLIAQDQSGEALQFLDESQPHAPPELLTAFITTRIQAELSLAFDSKDYETFFAKSEEFASMAPDDASAFSVMG